MQREGERQASCDVEDCERSPRWLLSGPKFDLGLCDQHKDQMKDWDDYEVSPLDQ